MAEAMAAATTADDGTKPPPKGWGSDFLLYPLGYDLFHNAVNSVDRFLVSQIVVVAKNRERDRAAS